jgi:ATPase subunit of ABC transporter with duplicated ATPase domains
LSLQIPEPDVVDNQDDISDITDEDITYPQVSRANTKKALKDAEKEAKKALKEAEKAAKIALKEAEKEAKKAKKEAEKAQEKAKKEAEEKAKKEAEEKAKKEAEEKANQKVSSDELSVEKFDCDEVVKPKPTGKATTVMYLGKKYIVNSENEAYDPETRIEVGYWNPAEKTIVFQEDEEEEDDDEDVGAEDSDEDD